MFLGYLDTEGILSVQIPSLRYRPHLSKVVASIHNASQDPFSHHDDEEENDEDARSSAKLRSLLHEFANNVAELPSEYRDYVLEEEAIAAAQRAQDEAQEDHETTVLQAALSPSSQPPTSAEEGRPSMIPRKTAMKSGKHVRKKRRLNETEPHLDSDRDVDEEMGDQSPHSNLYDESIDGPGSDSGLIESSSQHG
jgi:hypothetical protein